MVHSFYALPLWEMALIMLLGLVAWGLVGRVCTKRAPSGAALAGGTGAAGDRTGAALAGGAASVWRYVNCGLAIIWLAFILYLTVYGRLEGERELILVPFYSFVEAQVQPEMYRSMLANVVLFVPMGAFLSNGWLTALAGCDRAGMRDAKRNSAKRVIIITIVLGLLLSLCIEAAQFVFGLGRAEVDDVLTNTLGTAIGALSCLISRSRSGY